MPPTIGTLGVAAAGALEDVLVLGGLFRLSDRLTEAPDFDFCDFCGMTGATGITETTGAPCMKNINKGPLELYLGKFWLAFGFLPHRRLPIRK